MKQLVTLAFVIAMTAFACKTQETKVILSKEPLPTGQCVYTVSGKKPYTFIDDSVKYDIGQEIK